ncbi:MAG: type III-A CRISPR-associated RAMP protein Csm5 [Thermoplasmata archaeon]
MKSYSVEVEVLSPTHIGTGEKLGPSDYLSEANGKRIYYINLDLLLSRPGIAPDEVASAVSHMGEGLAGLIARKRILPKEVALEVLESEEPIRGEIMPHIRTLGKPYIPGSSLKGAIRTALLWKMLSSENELRKFALEELTRIAAEHKHVSPKKADDRIEARALSDERQKDLPHYDILRALRVSDITPLDGSATAIYDIGIFSLQTGRRIGGRGDRRTGGEKLSIPVEALRPGKRLRGELTIDEWLLHDVRAKELGFGGRSSFIEGFAEACRERSDQLIKGELERLKADPFSDARAFYQGLLKRNSGSSFTLQISWGTGWDAKSVMPILRDELGNAYTQLLNSLRIAKHRRPPGAPFPSTRHMTAHQERPGVPLGWVLISLR